MSISDRILKKRTLKRLADEGDGFAAAVLRTENLRDSAGKAVIGVTVVASGLAGALTTTAPTAGASVTQQGPVVGSAGNPDPKPKPEPDPGDNITTVYSDTGDPQTVNETNDALGHKGPHTGTIPQDTKYKPVTGGLTIVPTEVPGGMNKTTTPFPPVDPSSYEANHPDKGLQGAPTAAPGLTATIVGAAPVVAAVPAAGATALAAPLVLTGAMLADAQTVFDQEPPDPSARSQIEEECAGQASTVCLPKNGNARIEQEEVDRLYDLAKNNGGQELVTNGRTLGNLQDASNQVTSVFPPEGQLVPSLSTPNPNPQSADALQTLIRQAGAARRQAAEAAKAAANTDAPAPAPAPASKPSATPGTPPTQEEVDIVKRFQEDAGLPQDGIVGQNTQAALDQAKAASSATTSSQAPAANGTGIDPWVQWKLGDFNILGGGNDLAAYTRSIKFFQRNHRLQVDGKAGPQTRAKLAEGPSGRDGTSIAQPQTAQPRTAQPAPQIPPPPTRAEIDVARLGDQGFPTGSNGSPDVDAIKGFQEKAGLEPDGDIGPKTRAQLDRPPEDIQNEYINRRLAVHGFPITEGVEAIDAIKGFQEKVGIKVDGDVGKVTSAWLGTTPEQIDTLERARQKEQEPKVKGKPRVKPAPEPKPEPREIYDVYGEGGTKTIPEAEPKAKKDPAPDNGKKPTFTIYTDSRDKPKEGKPGTGTKKEPRDPCAREPHPGEGYVVYDEVALGIKTEDGKTACELVVTDATLDHVEEGTIKDLDDFPKWMPGHHPFDDDANPVFAEQNRKAALDVLAQYIKSNLTHSGQDFHGVYFQIPITYYKYVADPTPKITSTVVNAECSVMVSANGNVKDDTITYAVKTYFAKRDSCEPDSGSIPGFGSNPSPGSILGTGGALSSTVVGNSVFDTNESPADGLGGNQSSVWTDSQAYTPVEGVKKIHHKANGTKPIDRATVDAVIDKVGKETLTAEDIRILNIELPNNPELQSMFKGEQAIKPAGFCIDHKAQDTPQQDAAGSRPSNRPMGASL